VDKQEVRFDDRAFLVTGGGRGLGRAQALLLAARGAKVVVADNGAAMDGKEPDCGPAETVADDIRTAGGVAVACTADISTEAGSDQAVAASLAAFGRIDGIAHYASTSPELASADALSSRDLDIVMRVNPFAGLWMARAAWPHMVRQRYGRILYATSAGIYGSLGNAHYAAAKAAHIGMLRCLAIEGAGHGILVNGIAPSARTRMDRTLASVGVCAMVLRDDAAGESGDRRSVAAERRVPGQRGDFSLGGGRIARLTIAETDGVMGTARRSRKCVTRSPGDGRHQLLLPEGSR